jgi:hypothetical protein
MITALAGIKEGRSDQRDVKQLIKQVVIVNVRHKQYSSSSYSTKEKMTSRGYKGEEREQTKQG